MFEHYSPLLVFLFDLNPPWLLKVVRPWFAVLFHSVHSLCEGEGCSNVYCVDQSFTG
jgi:hypothetical protein